MIYITSDHGGFFLKESLYKYLTDKGYTITNEPPYTKIADDDYPDYVEPVMSILQTHLNDKAIVICRNGIGVSIVANKYPGIRAGVSWNKEHAISTRNDDNTNVLALPADYITVEQAENIVEAWLNTPFSHEEKHKRRIRKISNIENGVK